MPSSVGGHVREGHARSHIDGYEDLYIASLNHNQLFHNNNGDGTFTDVSVKSGIDKLIGKGMGVACADYDNDGYADLFISNDTFRNSAPQQPQWHFQRNR